MGYQGVNQSVGYQSMGSPVMGAVGSPMRVGGSPMRVGVPQMVGSVGSVGMSPKVSCPPVCRRASWWDACLL
jgi:hypothetical protein